MIDRSGQRFGNYQLIHLLGKGGFAEVYLGEHVYLKSLAAIKVLLTQVGDEEAEYFISEARLLMDLRHPHIVRVLEFGVEKDTPFLVMDYAPNGNLRQRHPRNTRLSQITVATYVRQVASALQYAHDQKLIHRDVKPENLLLQRNDEVLLSDFGIALIAQSSHFQSNSNEGIAGTATYMAPEQIQGKATFSSDQYSLGIIVYEWLSGLSPFQGSFSEICAQHMFTAPGPLRENVPTISPSIEGVVMTALAKEPQQRFASVMAFATALEHACQTDPSVQVTYLSSASNPLLRAPFSDRSRDNLAPSSAKPTDQESYTTSALDEGIAQPVGKSAPRDKITLIVEGDQASLAKENAAPVAEGKLSQAANENDGLVTPFSWRSISQRVLQRRIPPKALAAALIILAIFLGVNGLLYYAAFQHTSQTHIINQATATIRVSATPQVTNTASSSAAQQLTATTQPVITAHSTSTATPQTQPAQPTVATSPPQQAPTPKQQAPTPTPQTGPVLVLNDPLTAPDANQWDVFTYAGGVGGCSFNNGTYHATITQAGSFATCMARATNFANFTYQVQMTILSGTTADGGGLIFRSSNGSAYRFRVGVDGSFDLVDQIKTLVSSSSPAIKTGLNQTNVLTVVAQGSSISLYVNKQLIATVHDSLSSSGAIGMLAVDFTNPTNVAFSHAQVWQS